MERAGRWQPFWKGRPRRGEIVVETRGGRESAWGELAVSQARETGVWWCQGRERLVILVDWMNKKYFQAVLLTIECTSESSGGLVKM